MELMKSNILKFGNIEVISKVVLGHTYQLYLYLYKYTVIYKCKLT